METTKTKKLALLGGEPVIKKGKKNFYKIILK